MVSYSIISSFINAVSSLVFGIFVIKQNWKNIKNVTYFFFSFSVAVWSAFYFLWQVAPTAEEALFHCRGLMLGAIYIPVFYLHHIVVMLGPTPARKKVIVWAYAFAVSSSFFSFTPFFVSGVRAKMAYPFWPDPGVLFHPFLLFWVVVVIYGGKLIFESFRSASGLVRNQIKYILVATAVGWGGGLTNYFLWYDIPLAPVGNILVSVYVMLSAYVIIKYRLMDARLALTFTSLFMGVYGLVFGVPVLIVLFWQHRLESLLAGRWWIVPVFSYAVLSLAGPYLYSKLRREAEHRLLREQRKYQQTLLQASRGMTLIKDLNHLLKLIVHILTKTMRITHARIFLHSPHAKDYVCRAVRGDAREGPEEVIPEEASLVRELREVKGPLMLEEVRSQGPARLELVREMERSEASLAVPSFVQERLLGFVVLGDKKSKQLYTESDLDILTTLANQAALAIENCIFLTEFEQQQAHFFQAAKMADLGTMASGIGHQVNNRFNVIKLGAESASLVELRKLSQCLETNDAEGGKRVVEALSQTCRKIAQNAEHGGEIVKRLLDFSRLAQGFKAMDVREAIESSVRLWECKHDLREIGFRTEIAGDLRKVKGNFSEVEEILFNLLDNAADAIKMKEEAIRLGTLTRPEKEEKGEICLCAENASPGGAPCVLITVRENGIGMDEETRKKIFVPFFTTKATAIKGTGLGLYIIRRMVDAHQGHIRVESEYGKGTAFSVYLPAAEGG